MLKIIWQHVVREWHLRKAERMEAEATKFKDAAKFLRIRADELMIVAKLRETAANVIRLDAKSEFETCMERAEYGAD